MGAKMVSTSGHLLIRLKVSLYVDTDRNKLFLAIEQYETIE